MVAPTTTILAQPLFRARCRCGRRPHHHRNSRVPVAPAASRAKMKKHTSIVTARFTGVTRPSLRNGFNACGSEAHINQRKAVSIRCQSFLTLHAKLYFVYSSIIDKWGGKMRKLLSLALLALPFWSSSGISSPAEPRLNVLPQRDLPALKTAQTYAVNISCRPKGKLQPVSDDNPFLQTKYTTSHGILISTKPAIEQPDGKKLPDTGLAMSLIYVTDGNAGSELDNRRGCDQTFVVRRTDQLYLVPFINLHTANSAGFLTTVILAAVKPITSLISLIAGGPLASTVATRISGAQEVAQNFNDMLKLLNKDQIFASSRILGVGATTVTTDYSTVTVSVRAVSSLISDTKYDFSNDLRSLGEKSAAKVTGTTASDLNNSCAKLATNLSLDGVTAVEDRAFVVGFEALKTVTTQEQVMACLGRLVIPAAKLKSLWQNQDVLVITEDMAKDWYNAHYMGPQQLSFSELKPTLHELMVALGRYAKNGQPPSQLYSEALSKFFQNGVTVVDDTLKPLLGSPPLPNGFPDLVNLLIKNGYYHYGCFTQADDHTGGYVGNATSIFLVFKAAPDANTGKASEALAIHPIFSDLSRSIQSLNVSDSPDWISYVVAHRDQAYDCNGFQVQ